MAQEIDVAETLAKNADRVIKHDADVEPTRATYSLRNERIVRNMIKYGSWIFLYVFPHLAKLKEHGNEFVVRDFTTK